MDVVMDRILHLLLHTRSWCMILPLFLLFGSLIMVRRLLSSQSVDYFGYLCETDRKLTKERRSLFFFFSCFWWSFWGRALPANPVAECACIHGALMAGDFGLMVSWIFCVNMVPGWLHLFLLSCSSFLYILINPSSLCGSKFYTKIMWSFSFSLKNFF